MVMSTGSGNAAFLPDEAGDLIVRPVLAESVAAQVATVVTTGAASFRVPVVAADPSAAWVAEGDEITPSDATLDEVAVAFAKLAGLSIITRELADDSSPEAAQVVGDGLARDIARKLDGAWFGNLAAPAPAGLLSLSPTEVDTGASITSEDPFLEAISEAEQVGAHIGAWVTDPATALSLAQMPEATGSNRKLLQPDPTQPTRRVISGVPLYVSPSVTAGSVWGIPSGRALLVVRQDVRLDVDRSAFFTSDRVAVRATLRVGFAFPHEAAVVRLYDAP